MCGRFVSTNTPEQIASFFGASFEGDPLAPSYNVAPTNDIYAIVADAAAGTAAEAAAGAQHATALRAFHWGLVPVWAKDIKVGSSMINARSETLSEKATFKGLLRKRRCIIPMDGFYEWQAAGASAPLGPKGKPVKQPMFIHRADGAPLAIAGLWTTWREKTGPPDGPWLHSCTIITTAANAAMAPVHDRMPVILPAQAWSEWLDPAEEDIATLSALLVPEADDILVMHPVSTQVNNVRNKGAELILPISGPRENNS